MKTGLLWKEWRQNAWLFILIVVAFIGSEAMNATDLIQSFDNNYNYYQSDEFHKSNLESLNEDKMTTKDIEDSLKIESYQFDTNIYIFICVFLLLGLKLTVFEKNKQMDYFTNGLPYSKKQIFVHKLIIPTILLLLIIPSIMLVRFIYIYQQIPTTYLPDFSSLIIIIPYAALIFFFSFSIAIAVGNLVGDIIAAVIVALGSLVSIMYMFSASLLNLIYIFRLFILGKAGSEVDKGNEIWFSIFPYRLIFEEINVGNLIALVILILMMITISWIGIKTASMENNGRFLMNNKFRFAVLYIGSLYVSICLSGYYTSFNYENVVSTGMIVGLVIKMIVIYLLTALVLWFIMFKRKSITGN
ncbi:hypothetical protein HB802_10505 [Listeria welshimeri]|nr:hypothetical protein [Listeria welshimeri]MBC1347828.1 hypothetical protein [Listeria welshimeri]